MYQSVPSLTIPQARLWGIIFGFTNPCPWGKNHAKTTPSGQFLKQNLGKTTKNWNRNYEKQ